MTKTIRVALVDDHTIFRDGLTNLLSEYDDIEVIFKASNGQEMMKFIQEHDLPEVVLMDINMPALDGHQATLWLKENFPLVNVLALSMYENDFAIIRMIRNGARGYILKESNTEEVVRGIRTVSQHGFYLNDVVSGRLMHTMRADKETAKFRITDKEMTFLKLCCSELTYKEIASEMDVSPRTVDNYRESLFEKLNIKSRVGLVLYAVKNNIV